MSNRQIIYSRGTVTKLANALQLSRNTVTKALLGAYFDDPYGNMERVRTTAINQYGCKYAGRVISNGTEEGNGWATVSEAMTDEAGNIVPKPDGQSRDVTTGWILAKQDAIYDRRDEMAREEQLRQDAERRDAAAMEEQKQRGLYQGAVFNDGVTNWRVGAYDGSSYSVQSEDGQTKVMTYDEVKNMLEPSVQQVAQTAQPTQEVEPGTMFTYVNGEKAKVISKNEDGTWNVETDSGRTDTMPENYIQRTFVSAPEAAKQTESAAMPGAAEAGTTTRAEEEQQAPAAPTALSQIAPVTDKKGKVITDENGNPEDYQWETVEPSIALAGMREAGYDDIDIRDVANNNVESLAKEVSKASKKLSDAKTLIDKRKAREALNTANTRMGWWKDITAAMRPKEVGVKKDIATQNDETVTGIEDIQRRFSDGKRIAGRAETQTLQNGEEVSGHYELVEAGTVTPSHDFETFSSTKGFPTTAEGANINDRGYEHDEAAQTSVRNRASSYDKRAYQEPVFVSPDGIVYSGNDRTMSGMLAANQGTDTKYNASLREDASKFGFTPEQVDEFKHPRLVFVTDERLPYTTETMAKFNVPSGKTQNVTERKVKAAKTTSDETFAKIVELIGDSKMDDFYMFHGTEAIKLLQDRGIIQQNEVAALMNGTKLSDQGVELIETILIGKIFEDNTNAIRMFDAEGMGNVRKAIGYAVPELIKNKTLGEYSVMDYIAEMVEICYNAHEQGSIVSDYIAQSNLFDENPSEKYTNFAKEFAKEADRGTVFLRNTLSIFNNSAADEVGTESMFGKRTRDDILNELLNWSNNNNGRESGTEETENASAGSEASGAGDRIGSVRGWTDNEGGDERTDLGRDSGPDGSTDEGSSPVLEEQQPQLEPAEEFGDNPSETGLQDGRTWAEGESADAISDKVEEIENTISEITSSGNELTQDEKDYVAWGGGFIQSVQLAQQEAANSPIAPLYDIKDAPKPEGIKRAQRESLFDEGRRAFVKAHNSVPTIQLGENREELTFEKFADAYRNRVGEYTYSKDEPFLRPFYDYFTGKLNEEADSREQAVEDEKAKRRAKRQHRQNQQDLADAMVSHMEDMGINVTTDLDEKRAATKEWKAMFGEDGAFHGTDADKLKKLQGSEGSYGFVYRGRIYLDPRRMRPEAALHEYSHLWSEALRRANPDEWNNVVNILKNDTDTWDIVRSQYPELTNDNDIADEVLATYSGARGARRLAAEQQRLMSRQGITESERSKYNNIFANIRKAIQDFWKSVASFLGVRYESEEQIADQILKDFVDGVNPIAELKRRISLNDREYIEAATNGDLNRATELFNEALQAAIGNGVVPYMPWTDNYRTVQRDAHLVKLGDTDAIERTARRLAPMIPSNAVLIPMPGRTGRATDMLTLADAISKLTGNEVKDILRGNERESQRNAKLSGRGLTADELAMTATEEIPIGMVPVFIDNVVDTGATAEAAVKAVGRGVVIVLASTKGNYKHASHIKNASPVVYANGAIVPLSERFDVARQDVRFMKGGLLDMLDTSTENDELIKRYNDALEAITDESNEIGGMMYDSTDGAAVEEKRVKVSKLARQLFDELNIDLDAIRRNSIYGNGITEPIDKFGRMLVGDAADALSELEEAISNEIDRLEQVDIPDAEVESQKNQVPDENAQRKADVISAAREEILNTVYATYEDRVDWDEEHTEDEMRDIIRLVTDDIVDDYMESADDDVRSLVSDVDVSSIKDDAYKEAIGMYEDRRSEAFKDGYSAGMFEGGFNNEEDYTSWLKEYGEDPELLFEDAMGGDSSKYGYNISIRDYVRGHIQAIWERYLAEYPNAYGMPIREAKPVDMAKEDDFYQLADLLDDALSHILDFDKLEAANDFYMNLLNQFNDLEHIIPKNIQTIKSEVGRYRAYTYLITEQYNKMAKRRAAERKLYRIGKSGLIRLKNRVKKDMENVKEPVFGERLVKASMGRKAAIKALAENNGLKIVFIPINGLYPYTSALHYSGYTEGNTIVVNRFGLNPGNRAIGAIVKKLAKKDGVDMEYLSERMYPNFFNESEKAVEYLTSRGLSWNEARNEYYRREADPTIAAIFDSEVFAARAANVATDEEISFIDGMFERLSKIDAKGYSKDVAKARAAFNEAIKDRREKNKSKNFSADEDGNGVEFSVAYHGTKADFNVFDNAHMGEGEGAQAHGYGTYVAFDKSVGEGYARRIGQFGLTYEGIYPITTSYERAIVNDVIREAQGNETRDNIQAIIDRKKKQWKEAIASGKEWAEDAPKWLDFINNIDASDFEMKQERHLYIVDVPDDNGHNYLPEGKTIAKSDRKRIADVVRRIDNAELQRENHGSNWMPNGTESVANGIENNTIDAVEVRERLVDAFGSEKRASEIMSHAGFTGIKYDGNWDGECAVIFNADDIKIIENTRFSIPNDNQSTFTNDTDAKKLATMAELYALGDDVVYVSQEEADALAKEKAAERMAQNKKRALETASVISEETHQPTVVSSAAGAKVLQNLGNAKEYYKNLSNNTKDFIGNLSSAIGAENKGSDSQYATFETANGRIVTIRIANHNAKVSNFDKRGESEGISIVISAKKNKGAVNDGSAHLVEYFYDAIKLRRAEGKPLVSIIQSIEQSLYSGEYKDSTGLAEVQDLNGTDYELRRTDGTVYGYKLNGKIYLSPKGINPNTPVHEYTHLWATAMSKYAPEQWANIVRLLKGTEVWDEVLDDENYSDLKDDDAVASEVLARISGKNNAEKLIAEAEKVIAESKDTYEVAAKVTLINRVKQALNDFWNWVGQNLFGIEFTSVEQVTDRVLWDMLNHTNFEVEANEAGIETSKHQGRAPKKTGKGYKLFVVKDGKLYPPMVANKGGKETPVGVWLDAEAADPIDKDEVDRKYADVDQRMRRYHVKAGGKGTQGSSGKLAYRPGWHLGTIPYALQFLRKDGSFPGNFVWAEVEYSMDNDYQAESDERMMYDGKGKKFKSPSHAFGGLNHIPENGYYMYRTNPNPKTDPWVITGSMKVSRILTPTEVDDMVRKAGREPQKRQDGHITDQQVGELNRNLSAEDTAEFFIENVPTIQKRQIERAETEKFVSLLLERRTKENELADAANEILKSIENGTQVRRPYGGTEGNVSKEHLGALALGRAVEIALDKEDAQHARISKRFVQNLMGYGDTRFRAIREAVGRAGRKAFSGRSFWIEVGSDNPIKVTRVEPGQFAEKVRRIELMNEVESDYPTEIIGFDGDTVSDMAILYQRQNVTDESMSSSSLLMDEREKLQFVREQMAESGYETRRIGKRNGETVYEFHKVGTDIVIVADLSGVRRGADGKWHILEGDAVRMQTPRFREESEPSERKRKFDELKDKHGEDTILIFQGDNERFMVYDDDVDYLLRNKANIAKRRARGGFTKAASIEGNVSDVVGSIISNGRRTILFESYYDDRNKRIEGNEEVDRYPSMFTPNPTEEEMDDIIRRGASVIPETPRAYALEAVDKGDTPLSIENIGYYIYKHFGRYQRRIFNETRGVYRVYDSENPANGIIVRETESGYYKMDRNMLKAKLPAIEDAMDAYANKLYVLLDLDDEYVSESAKDIIEEDLADLNYARKFYRDLAEGRQEWRTAMWPRFRWIGEIGAQQLQDSGLMAYESIIRDRGAAETMEKAGKTAKEIKIATGWERGADGKWRYEMRDLKVKDEFAEPFNEYDELKKQKENLQSQIKELEELFNRYFNVLSEKQLRDILDQAANKRYEANEVEKSATTFAYKNHRLSNVIDDKELFDTYPQLNDVFVSFHPNIKGGGVDSNSHHITVGTELSPREVLIHEIQHIIQDIEGFAEGGNVHTLDDVIEEAELTQNDVYRIKEDSGFYDFIIKCIENPETEEEKLINKRLNERDFDSVDYYMNNVADSQTREDWEKANKRLDAMKQSFGSLISSVDASTYDAYHRLAGEVEARNAENRRDMTDEQRRTTPMAETEDVPRDEQLFTYGNTAEQLAKALNVDVEVISSRDELSEDMKREIGNRRVKGWYNPTTGGVSVFLPNATSDNDIKRTILHEIVGHKGLRELVGSNNYDDWMLDLFNNLPKNVRDRVLERAKFKEWDIPYTMDEFLAEQAEREYTPTWWQKVKGAIRNMLRFIGVDVELTDADVKYLLWRSRRHLEGDDIFDMAMNAIIKGRAKRSRGRYNTTASMRYRSEENMEDFTEEELEPLERRMGTVAAEYDDALRKASYKFQESYQDSMLGLKKFMEIAAKRTGKPITDAENAYMYENEMTSRNQAHYEEWKQQFFVPLEKAFLALKKAGASEKDIINYMIAKHGLERNEIFARRDAKYQFERYKEEHPKTRKTEDDFFYKNREKDYSGLTGLTGEADVAAAEEAAREYVAGFEAKYGNELTGQLWEKTNAATKATLENSYMAGIIDQERYEQIRDEFEYYIPLRGWEQTTADEVYDYLNSNDGPYNAPIKVAKGRWSVADNPIATIGNMAISGIVEANRNRLKQRFLTFVTNHKTDGASVSDLWVKRVVNETDGTEQWVAVFPDITSDMLNAAQVMKLTQQFDEHMQKLAAKDPVSYMRVSEKHHIPFKIKTGDLKEHQVIVKKNGVPVVITINGNPRAAQAINGKTNPETVDNPFVKITNWFNRFLSANVTTRNPAFVTANLVRDMFYSNTSAWIKESPAYAAAYNRNWAKVLTKIGGCIRRYKRGTLDMSNPMDKMFADFIHNGGETGYTVIKDVEDYKKLIEKDIKNFNAKTMSARWILSHLVDARDTFGRWAEGTSRFAAYVTSVEMGRSVDKSIHDAKEISVNFNKKGAGSRTSGKLEKGNIAHYLASWGSQTGRGLYVFWNAGVQGLTNFGRMAVSKQTAAKSLTAAALYFCMGAAVAMMASAGGDDDDEEMMSEEELRRKRRRDYYNLPKYVRRNNICFRVGNMWVTIPLPIELRAFYGLGELAYGSLSGKEKNVGKEVVEQVSQIMPIDMMEGAGGLSAFVPSSVKPLYEVGQNVDWTGKPLYKKHEYNEDMPNWTKAYKSTSPMLIRVSRALNEVTGGTDATKGYIDINPASVEHIFEGYLGGVATMAEQASKSVQMIWNEDLRDWRNVPVASRFLKSGNADAWQYAVNNMYFVNKEHVDGVTQAVNKYKKALGVEGLSEREKAKNEKWLNNVITSEDYRRCLQWKEMDKQMNKLNKAYKERPSKDLEKQMLELKAQMNAIFEEEDEHGDK